MGLRRFLRLQKLSWRALFQPTVPMPLFGADCSVLTPSHPSLLCRCEDRRAHEDQSPHLAGEGHYVDCEWFAVMCRVCDGAGHCQNCYGDGVAPIRQCRYRYDAGVQVWVECEVARWPRCCLDQGHDGVCAVEKICLTAGKIYETAEDAQRFRDHLPRCPVCVSTSVSPLISDKCDHGVAFDPVAAEKLSSSEIKRRWPRLDGPCPKGCGFSGIAYASTKHYVFGDW